MERKEDSDWVKACQWAEVNGKMTWQRQENVKSVCRGHEGAWIEGGGCTGKIEVEVVILGGPSDPCKHGVTRRYTSYCYYFYDLILSSNALSVWQILMQNYASSNI
jgi:hypothetical protein